MEGKTWYQSKTIWGLVLAAAGLGLNYWHVLVPTDDATVSMIIDIATKGAEVVGMLVALWGRIKATQPIGTPK
jgi:hypothetical protein